MNKALDVTTKTTLKELLERNRAAVLEVLTTFGLIHCSHCEIDESQTVESVCKAHGAPATAVAKALAAALVRR